MAGLLRHRTGVLIFGMVLLLIAVRVVLAILIENHVHLGDP